MNESKNRGWVKNAAIVFLAVLLVLTFFSNTIMNRALPEVATQAVTSDSITAKVRGTGRVESNGSYQVRMEQTREIRAVMVKEGQEVNAGDVLFILGEGTSEELEAAQENLRQLQLNYQRTAVGMPSYDYSLEERKIEQAEEELKTAQEAEAAAKKLLEESSSVSESDLQAAQAKLDFSIAARDKAQQDYEDKVKAAQERVDNALAKLNELLDNPPAPESPVPSADPVDVDDSGSEGQSGSGSSSYQQQLEDARAELEAAQAALEALTGSTDPAVAAAQKNVNEAQAALDELLNKSGPYAEKYNQAVEARKAAEDELFTLKYNLTQTQIQNGKSAQLVALELQDLNVQIEKAKKELEELSGGEGNQILANVGGIIESINYTAGSTVPADEVLCAIQVPDMGYTLSFSVTNEQAKRLRPGDSATVSNYYWGSQIVATLTTIRTDPQNPQTNRILEFDLSGDVTAGAELTISVGQKSATYDFVVPNSAVRSDSNGSFILVIEAKNSPLGNRYIAKRVEVTVLASDDVNSAVSGDINRGDFVITTSSMPVQRGDQVRMADEQ